MRNISVYDSTLQSLKANFTFREKLNISKNIEQIGIDAIVLPPLSNNKDDEVIYRTVALSAKKCKVCIPVGTTEDSVNLAYECVKSAQSPSLQVVLPVSTVQMEYMYHLKAPAMLDKIATLCNKASSLCNDVEFVAADMSRADSDLVIECIKTACQNGAKSVTLCDDAGVYLPNDFASIISQIKQNCDIKIIVKPSNAIGMAVACVLASVKAGADGVVTTADDSGLNANVFSDFIRVKGDQLGVESNLDFTVVHHILSNICQKIENATDNAVTNSDGKILDKNCTITDIIDNVKSLGYNLSDDDNGKVYAEFQRVIGKKKSITTRELDAIVATSAMQVPSTFHLKNYVVNSGNCITATAQVTLEKNGVEHSGVSIGDGPIDASFHAIEQIIGHHYELDDFQVQAVTKGREAVGSSLIRLMADGKVYSGNGVSTDIVGACIRAYINALNKIVYAED